MCVKSMKDDVIVSVIVLTYNHVRYITRALDSVLDQNCGFIYEVLIGDDASDDGTSDIVREYAKMHPRLIRAFVRNRNVGATANLADLLRKARGKYIIGCEGDDYWTDAAKLRKQVEYMEVNPELSGCTHNITVVDADGEGLIEQRLRWICRKKVYTIRDFRGILLPGHPVSFLHLNCFDESDIAFIENAHEQIADRTIAMIVSSKGEIHRIDGNMACYRKVRNKNAQNLTSRLYIEQADAKLNDLRMTNKLERYAKIKLKADVSFNGFRFILLIRAIGKMISKPSKQTFNCLVKIIMEWRI